MNFFYNLSRLSFLFLLCGLIYFPFIGEVNLFDWDETILASVSKEMFMRDEVLQPWLNGNYFLEMPPFFFWLQLVSFKYLGIKEYAARLPNAICAILVVLTLYKNGKRIYSSNFGLMWAMIYISMLLPQLYHRSGLAEPWFCFFIYLSIYNLVRVIEARQESGEKFYRKKEIFSNLFYSFFAAVGAFMTKGIEGYIVILLTYWLVFLFSSAKYGFGYFNILKWTFYFILFILIWVGIEYKWHGNLYLKSFFNYQWETLNLSKATWTHRISFQFIILLLGCFPASIFALNSLRIKSYESAIQKIFRLSMVSCLIIVLIIVSLFKIKLAHYSVLAYFPISFLAAYSIRYILEEGQPIKKITYILYAIGATIWTASLIILPLSRANIDILENYIHEDTLHLALTSHYPWENLEIIFGICFFLLFSISFLLLVYRKRKTFGFIVLFVGCLILNNALLLYYVPKLEQWTQGPQVEFVTNNKNEKAYYHYFGGISFIPKFYSDSALILNQNFELDSLASYAKSPYPNYIITKMSDTMHFAKYKEQIQPLYNQGIYSFYKIKQ
ncbi:MAG: glycosyltransferase family 39 protein [Chitinophagales bacterium]|nr:glycosyltransferase family 39 protein [Chitinophagales bacterium]